MTVGQAYETDPDAPEMPQLRLAEGASADTISWPNLGYADAYAESFEIFDRLQQAGTIAPGVRLQVQYPTPLASMGGTFVPEDMAAVHASYEQALFADLDDAAGDGCRTTACAVQWDVAVEFGLLEGAFGPTHADGAHHARAGPLRRPRAGGRPGRVPPLLRRLRPPALQAARVDPDAGGPRQRRQRRGAAAARLGVVHRAAGDQRRRLLRAAERPGGRAGDRALLRARARTTPTIRPRARPPRRSSTSTARWRGPRAGRASGGSAPSAGWDASRPATCPGCSTSTGRSSPT